MDVSLIANEVIDSLLKRNACGVICKLEMEKAYDRIYWDFFFFFLVLNKMRFDDKWIRCIRWCIFYCKLINFC